MPAKRRASCAGTPDEGAKSYFRLKFVPRATFSNFAIQMNAGSDIAPAGSLTAQSTLPKLQGSVDFPDTVVAIAGSNECDPASEVTLTTAANCFVQVMVREFTGWMCFRDTDSSHLHCAALHALQICSLSHRLCQRFQCAA